MKRPPAHIDIAVAGPEQLRFVESISRAIRREVEKGTLGMALRSPGMLREKILSGDAVLAVDARKGDWAGFCYVSPWEGGAFVATSALIVRTPHRGLGVARRLKEVSFDAGRRRYPGARFFGLTTSEAVARINLDLGFKEVTYAQITRDPGFWQGCETCPHHTVLQASGRQSCWCKAMLWEPTAGSDRPSGQERSRGAQSASAMSRDSE